MLLVNNEYTLLDNIICGRTDESDNIDESYTVGAGFSEQDVLDKFKSINSKIDERELTQFIDFLYDKWRSDGKLKGNANSIPFRFDSAADGKRASKIVNIARVYKSIISKEYSINDDKFNMGGISFKYGNGSLFSNRSAKGLEYEGGIIGELQQLIAVASDNTGKRHLSEKKLKSLIDNPSVYHLIPIYTSGDLDNAIKAYKNGTPLDELVIGTGKVDPRRNTHNEMWSDDFDIDTTNDSTQKVLENSGRIISDVTITTDPPVYVSVKIESAQLSGVFCSNILKNNKSLISAAKNGASYNDIENTSDMRAFKNFCNAIGADPTDLYNKYKDLYNDNPITDFVKTTQKYNSLLLGNVFQKLIGGNCWYVKPSTSVFIPSRNLHLDFVRSHIRITPSGKKIIAYGSVNGIDARVELRTAGEGKLPYRVFPVISVPALLETIVEEDSH